MEKFPSYLGVKAFGVKIGAILPGDDIVGEVSKAISKCHEDHLIDDGDIICVKESIVARAQDNFISKEDISKEVREKLNLSDSDTLGILFPIASRNRFVPILEGLVTAVPKGKVVIQFSYPRDCVGNQIAPEELEEQLGINLGKDEILADQLEKYDFRHPATGVNYIKTYEEIIKNAAIEAEIFLSNHTSKILDHKPNGIIVSCIHERDKIVEKIKKIYDNIITLQDLFNDNEKVAWSEWGLLGSNMYSDDKIKLPPKESFIVAQDIQKAINNTTGKKVEVMIYGDGAYMDPSTGIYELADPACSFGHSDGMNTRREGIKYKFFVGTLHAQGKKREEIEEIINKQKQKSYEIDDISMEGTTPRRLEDIAGSLADLVSGSADASTPIVIIKDLLR
ncbi:MAG: coenzyme F420-0:L-glutamate ligase [Candidatus Heimdallarchaeota archaeon]|nr:coenzyme F420-0:L-glutamate ligase [Candidatus Heimdallarchaeota archaeon]